MSAPPESLLVFFVVVLPHSKSKTEEVGGGSPATSGTPTAAGLLTLEELPSASTCSDVLLPASHIYGRRRIQRGLNHASCPLQQAWSHHVSTRMSEGVRWMGRAWTLEIQSLCGNRLREACPETWRPVTARSASLLPRPSHQEIRR